MNPCGCSEPQVFVMLVAALVVLVAFSLYLPLFFFNVAWFLPLALLPRGVLSELLVRSKASRTDARP